MKPHDHDLFWQLYDRNARASIERACLHTSRIKSDSTMDVADMVAWIDTRIWTMLEKSAWPTFHDNPTPQEAVDRIVKHASTLARWSYLGLCRSHFRRLENRAEYMGGMSRAQRLSMASSTDTTIEKREELDNAIASLRSALSAGDKQKLAASWADKEDRSRVALVLGATRKEDDRMITKVNGNAINDNTVQQMRSRARKRAQEVLNAASKVPMILIAGVLIVSIGLGTSTAKAGEQTGGRKGTARAVSQFVMDSVALPGEQTGGRNPKNAE